MSVPPTPNAAASTAIQMAVKPKAATLIGQRKGHAILVSD